VLSVADETTDRRAAIEKYAGAFTGVFRPGTLGEASQRVALIVLDASIVIAHLGAGDTLHALATSYMREHVDDDLRLPASAYMPRC
jgi:hypothetical protein